MVFLARKSLLYLTSLWVDVFKRCLEYQIRKGVMQLKGKRTFKPVSIATSPFVFLLPQRILSQLLKLKPHRSWYSYTVLFTAINQTMFCIKSKKAMNFFAIKNFAGALNEIPYYVTLLLNLLDFKIFVILHQLVTFTT